MMNRDFEQDNRDAYSTLWSSLKSLGNAELAAALTDGTGVPGHLKAVIPRMPPDDVQIATTSKAGLPNMVEAVDFAKAVAARFDQYGPKDRIPYVLDFGSGWGRIARAFLGYVPASSIEGSDVRPDIVKMAKDLAPSISFRVFGTHPPVPEIESGSKDLIVGYSVFSHLSEATAAAWIKEFARFCAPAGLVCITTRARAHLVASKANSMSASKLTGHTLTYAKMTKDFDSAIADYDAGKFVYIPTGGGGMLSKDFYGEAIVPMKYVEQFWTEHFDLVEWIEKFSRVGTQPLIILQRKNS